MEWNGRERKERTGERKFLLFLTQTREKAKDKKKGCSEIFWNLCTCVDGAIKTWKEASTLLLE
jgi:hypothetical protein